MKNKNDLPEPGADFSTDSKSSQKARQVLRRRAEEMIQEKAARSSENPESLSPEKMQQTLHELQVHQIELGMQNEELRRAQAELEEARARYFDLYDLAPVGYFTNSENGLIQEANLTATTLLGITRGALVKQPISRFILQDDQDIYYLHLKKIFQTGTPQVCELRMVKKDGSRFWVRLEATASQNTEGVLMCRAIMSDISDLKQVEDKLKGSLREKETLLREVHHRVKNNLTSIIGLINLQQNALNDPFFVATLDDLSSRIHAMALVHELLYQSETLSRIDLQNYLETLVGRLRASYQQHTIVRLCVTAKGVEMDLDTAIPCGLIVNELVTNAFKYAFPNGQARTGEPVCEIRVTAERNDDAYILTISDNGVGLPADFDWTAVKSLGLQLVLKLGQYQLNSQIELDRSCGTSFRLRFVPRNTK